MTKYITIILIAITTLVLFLNNDADAMAKCQESYSKETCHNILYR